MNFIEVKAKLFIVARDETLHNENYQERVVDFLKSQRCWGDYGIPEADLYAMAGGDGNVILTTYDHPMADSASATFAPDGHQFKQFRYEVSHFWHIGAIACTKDGRNFTTEEARQLQCGLECHLHEIAKNLGALYYEIDAPDGSHLYHCKTSAAHTCEISYKTYCARRDDAEEQFRQREKFFRDLFSI